VAAGTGGTEKSVPWIQLTVEIKFEKFVDLWMRFNMFCVPSKTVRSMEGKPVKSFAAQHRKVFEKKPMKVLTTRE
jgi:hypothetical protein